MHMDHKNETLQILSFYPDVAIDKQTKNITENREKP